ncbi:MAG TPA: helix-turn-helix transcriptional regulator [Planctomycetota bacterium]|nr:helix-turn-helix transcriptional regulator [Planctomycetota bacterium]
MKNSNHKLTRRHVQILQLMARGLTSEETAKRLGIDAKTVATHRAGLLVRLNAQNAPHAIWLAMKRGLIR